MCSLKTWLSIPRILNLQMHYFCSNCIVKLKLNENSCTPTSPTGEVTYSPAVWSLVRTKGTAQREQGYPGQAVAGQPPWDSAETVTFSWGTHGPVSLSAGKVGRVSAVTGITDLAVKTQPLLGEARSAAWLPRWPLQAIFCGPGGLR